MRVLVVGAGIGGDALAVMLGRAGWDVTVVEIARELRTGGQTVDLRGDSREVLQRLGVLAACLSQLVPQRGIAWVDRSGRRLADMPVTAFRGKGFVSAEELLRSDLSRVLHEAAAVERVRHWFGDTAERLEQTPTGVRVTFGNHEAAVFDVVVGADGAHSRVRSLVFGPEEQFRRPLGLAHAWFTLTETPHTPDLDGWYLVHNAAGSKVVEARPGHPGEQEVGLTFPADALPPRGHREARLAVVDRALAGVGWRTEEILSAARTAPDFALDTFDQIDLPQWHRGRVVLLGDSAWCASPLSGLGTALALHGAEALAGALVSQAATLEDRLTDYQSRMTPRVQAAQRMFPGRVRSFAPQTNWGIRAVSWALRLVQTRLVANVIDRTIRPTPHNETAEA